jgi:hypothetical protein
MLNAGPLIPPNNLMKLNIITPSGAFCVEGADAASIVQLISAPPWVATAIEAWRANDGRGEHSVHFAPGYAALLLEDVAREEDCEAMLRKHQTYSDYHKDFYGFRPRGVEHLGPREIAVLYDKISEEHSKLMQTPEGRSRLRANGWIAEEPAGKPAARKVAAKKAARRK